MVNMKKQLDQDFRVAFAQMDPRAVICREELAALLCRTPAAISLLAHRGRLPHTAFPSERKACWFVQDIRAWLDEVMSTYSMPGELEVPVEGVGRRIGRPRAGEGK
jgi:hypothetical protein